MDSNDSQAVNSSTLIHLARHAAPNDFRADIAVTEQLFDHSAFSRAFRSATGITPISFRQQAATSRDQTL